LIGNSGANGNIIDCQILVPLSGEGSHRPT
jgi:hypothetical protein